MATMWPIIFGPSILQYVLTLLGLATLVAAVLLSVVLIGEALFKWARGW